MRIISSCGSLSTVLRDNDCTFSLLVSSLPIIHFCLENFRPKSVIVLFSNHCGRIQYLVNNIVILTTTGRRNIIIPIVIDHDFYCDKTKIEKNLLRNNNWSYPRNKGSTSVRPPVITLYCNIILFNNMRPYVICASLLSIATTFFHFFFFQYSHAPFDFA